MEIGQLVFGHVSSEGHYEIPRSWEHLIYTLYDMADVDLSDDFSNDVFELHPYWWGECTCGWNDLDNGHSKLVDLNHREDCIQTEIKELDKKFPRHDNKSHKRKRKELKKIYEKFGLSTEGDDWWYGYGLVCTCDYRERQNKILEDYAKEFGHVGHLPTCKLEIPNFYYKPEDYKLWWYKYPLRSAYSNKLVTEKHFIRIIRECINSL